ncbi:MAG: flavodoxin [Victivallaceae bacterium]|nr:flavodoxin [Victivallaceae bacterium]
MYCRSWEILIAYYSFGGNTRALAGIIGGRTGGNLFEIETAQPYPRDFTQLHLRARKEIAAAYMPELKSRVEDISQYKVVFIGTPVWWSNPAPAAAAFLAGCDLSKKTVVPFITHSGGRTELCESRITGLCPHSIPVEPLIVLGSHVANADAEARDWLRRIGIPY